MDFDNVLSIATQNQDVGSVQVSEMSKDVVLNFEKSMVSCPIAWAHKCHLILAVNESPNGALANLLTSTCLSMYLYGYCEYAD